MKKLRFYEKEKLINAKRINGFLLWVFQIVVVIAIAWALVFYWGQKTSVVGQSMEPLLQSGKEVWMNKLSYMLSAPKRGDVIVFTPNGNENAHFYIKRVVGLPGETIQIIEGSIYIDGELLVEKETRDKIEEAGMAGEPYVIGEDEYFVLGDNRNNSEDSRNADIGTVSIEYIEGKAWLWNGEGFSFGRIR